LRPGRLDLVVQRRELAIDDDDAVLADRGGNVAAFALDPIDAVTEIGDFHLRLGEIRSLLRAGGAGKRHQTGRDRGPGEMLHGWSSLSRAGLAARPPHLVRRR